MTCGRAALLFSVAHATTVLIGESISRAARRFAGAGPPRHRALRAFDGPIRRFGVQRLEVHRTCKAAQFFSRFSQFDGMHYQRILSVGYVYNPGERLRSRLLSGFPFGRAVGWSDTSRRADTRTPDDIEFLPSRLVCRASRIFDGANEPQLDPPVLAAPGRSAADRTSLTIALYALAPCAMFFHLAYSESCFLLVATICLLGFERDWPAPVNAVLVGLCGLVRPVGIALLVPFAWHLWSRSPNLRSFLVRTVALAPLACWGLLAYMAFQYCKFGDAPIFATTQEHWRVRTPISIWEKVVACASWEPIWSVYAPRCPGTGGTWTRRFRFSVCNS